MERSRARSEGTASLDSWKRISPLVHWKSDSTMDSTWWDTSLPISSSEMRPAPTRAWPMRRFFLPISCL